MAGVGILSDLILSNSVEKLVDKGEISDWLVRDGRKLVSFRGARAPNVKAESFGSSSLAAVLLFLLPLRLRPF